MMKCQARDELIRPSSDADIAWLMVALGMTVPVLR